MTTSQRATLWEVLRWTRDAGGGEFHHGDCVGVDWEAAQMATSMGLWTVAHPPLAEGLRAFHPSREVRDPADYLDRDRALAREVERMIGLPGQPEPVARSGTWYTIAYAERIGRTVLVVPPDGTLVRRGRWPS